MSQPSLAARDARSWSWTRDETTQTDRGRRRRGRPARCDRALGRFRDRLPPPTANPPVKTKPKAQSLQRKETSGSYLASLLRAAATMCQQRSDGCSCLSRELASGPGGADPSSRLARSDSFMPPRPLHPAHLAPSAPDAHRCGISPL